MQTRINLKMMMRRVVRKRSKLRKPKQRARRLRSLVRSFVSRKIKMKHRLLSPWLLTKASYLLRARREQFAGQKPLLSKKQLLLRHLTKVSLMASKKSRRSLLF